MDNTPNSNGAGSTDTPAGVPTPTPIPSAESTGATPNTGTSLPESQIEITETTIMAALSYLSILVFIPFLTQKHNPFVMFHVKQGLLVFAITLLAWVVGSFLWGLSSIINLCAIIFAIIGIIHALKKEEKALPIIGTYASHIKL